MEGKPVCLLSAIFQHSPLMLMAKKRADLKVVQGLKGKRLMVTDDVAGMASLTAMLIANGIKLNDYTSQKHTFNMNDLISGQTDAIAAYISNEPYQMEQLGEAYTLFAPKDHGFDFYGDILFTSRQLYADNPQLVERFQKASLRGWEYAFSRIDETIEMILKKYNTQHRTKDALLFEANTLKALAFDDDIPLGDIHIDRLKQIAQVYQLLGLTVNPLKTENLIFTPKVNMRLHVTAEEKAWLTDHGKIIVGGEMDWAPFDFVDDTGQYTGIANDYLNIIGQKLGIEIEIITGLSWNELLTGMRKKEIDVLPAIYHTEERETFVHFTSPYLKLTEFIFANSSDETISRFTDLKEKTIVVVKGYAIEEELRFNYPEYNLITALTIQDALNKLVISEADAFIGDFISTSFNIREFSFIGIKPVASVPLKEPEVHMGVRKDWPILKKLIDKALKTIPEREHNAIKNKWMSFAEKNIKVNRDKTQSADKVIALNQWVGYGVMVFLCLGLLIWILIRSIRKETIAVSFGSPWFRGLLLAGLSVFVLIVAFLGWYNLKQNKTHLLHDVDENLKGLLSISQDRFDLWLQERTSYMKRLGRDPELVAITRRLLQVDPGRDMLLKSEALNAARSFFKDNKDIFSNIGFFIINPDHISIGSRRDTNIGTRNLIAGQFPERLQQAFAGEVGFVPPLTSDVYLGTSSPSGNGKKPPTMFFIGPVQDVDGRVLAVMTLRVDPWNDFIRAMKTFGSMETREIYAFDSNGTLLSASRFEEQLRRIGLLADNQGSALNIQIRNPGGNLIKGYRPKVERVQQPLTVMARQAIEQKRQLETAKIYHGHSPVVSDLEGYRDYRGVPVFGAWLWNADLNIGLSVEVDVDEVLAHYNRTRVVILSTLVFTLVLSVGAILFVLIIGERTSRALMRARDNLENKVAKRTEQLAVAEERSRLLLDSVGEGIFGVDTRGRAMFSNPAVEDMLGFTSDELKGQNIHALIHHSCEDGSDYPEKQCPMYKSFTDGTAHLDMEILWRKDGSNFPVDYMSTPIHREGQLTGAVIVIRDITDRKKVEVELRRAKEKAEAKTKELVALVHGLPIPTALFDPEGDVMVINQAFTSLLGYTITDIPDVEAHWAPFYPDVDYRAKIKENWTKRVEKSAQTGNPIQPMDLLVASKTGQVYALQAHTVQIGRVAATMWVNFSEQKQMEKVISEERERLQKILDTSPVGVAFSTKGKIQFTNPMFEKMFAVSVGDVSPNLYVNPEERHHLVSQLTAGENIENYEIKMYGHDGEIRDMLVNYLLISYQGEEGILGWLLDITDRKKAEQDIKDKFNDLTRFRKLAVGREQKMIELKKEINELTEQLGKGRKYKIV